MSNRVSLEPTRSSETADKSGPDSEELIRLKADLKEARRRLDLTIEAAGTTCSWDWDIVNRRFIADAAFALITGQDPIVLANGTSTHHFFVGIHPDDVVRVRLAVAGILAGAELFSKEYRLVREDGGFRWVHAKGQAEYDANDQPIKFSGVLVDITDQKRIQEQLRISQVAGEIGTFEHVAGFGTVSVSEQFCQHFGLHPAKVLSIRTLNSMIHPQDPPIVDLSAPHRLQEVQNSEFRIRRADDGEERWLTRRGEYVQDAEAPGRRYIGVIYDITAAKHTQERLREANLALARRVREGRRERDRMWQNSRDLFVVFDVDGIFRDVNPAALKVLGYEPDHLIGRHYSEFTFEEDRQVFEASLRHSAGDTQPNFETRHSHKNGNVIRVSWVISHDKDISYAYGRDITVEWEQAETLRETAAQLQQSQKMEAVGQLTGGIAHDFNNMLTGIIGALAMLRRRISAGRVDDIDRFIEAATTSAQRAASLTHRLLAFSRRQSLDRKPVDVNKLVSSMEDLFHRTLGEQIDLSTHFETDTAQAFTDANQLESAVLNLIINARDAMPNGGQLTVETGVVVFNEADVARYKGLEAGSYVVLAVSDTGTGMSKETIEKAFEPFFTTKPIGQGTGLGLSMIYGFAQQSGGHVRIYSEVGQGTTVKLYLPRDDSLELLNPAAISVDLSASRGHGETVLVVEDDPAVRMLVTEVLRELGYQTVEAIDGDVALPILESTRRIDLLISDVGLPGLNGRQIAEIAIAKRPNLKVLFITGYAATAASRADFLAPGMEMITKPFSVDDLANKVREMLTSIGER